MHNIIILLILFISFCKQISVPDIYPEFQEPKEINQYADEVCVIINGKDLEKDSFIRAYSISRLFSSQVKNQSGSLLELLKKGILKRSYQEKIQVIFNKSGCKKTIFLNIHEYEFIWYPPQEFIQNPIPIRKGEFLAKFDADYTILKGKKQAQKNFRVNIKLYLLPGEEYNSIERTVAQILKDFIDEFYLQYWVLN